MIVAVIPAYNEEKHLKDVVIKTKRFVDRVIVVDDGSADRTYEIAKKCADTVMRHPVNMGKGFALRTGFEEAVGEGARTIVMLDADGQHEPSEIPRLLKAAEKKDFVLGVRSFSKMPFNGRFANTLLNMAVKVFFRMKSADTQSGFRAVNVDAYDRIKWKSNEYEVETEMLANAFKNKVSYAEVPISTIYHDVYKGTSFFDGIKLMFSMLKWRLF